MKRKLYWRVLAALLPTVSDIGFLFPHLASNLLQVRNPEYLRDAMGWTHAPVIEGSHLRTFQYLEDLNGRKLRDAEVLGAACCNGEPKILLEIGTSHGHTTALMAENAPRGIIYTINIPPEEISEGGKNVTFAPSRQEIGYFYREKGCTNVVQILKNTKEWKPDFGTIDVAFIDGCHDAEFVYNDTRKVLTQCRSGSIIMWHDFAPELVGVYPWVKEVCQGVERLYEKGYLRGRILHLQDSWIGLYRVG